MKQIAFLIFFGLSLGCKDNEQQHVNHGEIFSMSATIGGGDWAATSIPNLAWIDEYYSPPTLIFEGRADNPDTLSLFMLAIPVSDSLTAYSVALNDEFARFFEQVGVTTVTWYTNRSNVGHLYVDSLGHWDADKHSFYVKGRFDFVMESQTWPVDSLIVTDGNFEIKVNGLVELTY